MSTAGIDDRPVGVLLAAGRSRRMGLLKQVLPWPAPDGAPLVAVAHDAVRPACRAMIVVVGHERDRVLGALADREVHVVDADPDAPMLESIQAGLCAVRHLAPDASALVHPADHPGVAPETLERLLDESSRRVDTAIMPEYEGRGGHPVIIPPPVIERVTAWSDDGGLRVYWTQHPDERYRLPVDDPAVVRDLDRPEDTDDGALRH